MWPVLSIGVQTSQYLRNAPRANFQKDECLSRSVLGWWVEMPFSRHSVFIHNGFDPDVPAAKDSCNVDGPLQQDKSLLNRGSSP